MLIRRSVVTLVPKPTSFHILTKIYRHETYFDFFQDDTSGRRQVGPVFFLCLSLYENCYCQTNQLNECKALISNASILTAIGRMIYDSKNLNEDDDESIQGVSNEAKVMALETTGAAAIRIR